MIYKYLLVIFYLAIQSISATKILCYHGSWSAYRTGNGTFKISDIDTNLCTHYIYAFIGIDIDTMKVKLLDEWLAIELGSLASAASLRNKNPNLKVLVAVGGWNEGSVKFSTVAASASNRATFINSVINFLQSYQFDGLDVDWEYPASTDKNDLVLLLQEMREAFDKYGYILTAAVSASLATADASYDVKALSENLDVINLMTYDFFGSWDGVTGHNAPIYSKKCYTGTAYASYNANTTIQGWLARGAAANKLALGIPFYGRTYILASSNNNGVNAPSIGDGPSGPYTATAGQFGYNEILEKFATGGWTENWDDEAQAPYAYQGTTWLSYDNTKSITLKVESAKKLGLGGIMVWSIETDDFLGLSGTKFQLLTTINNALGKNTENLSTVFPTSDATIKTAAITKIPVKPESTISTSKTKETTSTTTIKPLPSDQCSSTGFVRDASNCSQYYYCQPVNGAYQAIKLTCYSGLVYDTETGTCNWPDLVKC